jgi:LysM repeat protein
VAETSAPGQGSRRISWGSRILAPLALIVVVAAILAIVSANTGSDNSVSQDTKAQIASENPDKTGPENPRTYTVEEGDTLGAIAEKFDVSTKRLERLNPDIDPQTLNAGQELQIR